MMKRGFLFFTHFGLLKVNVLMDIDFFCLYAIILSRKARPTVALNGGPRAFSL